MSADPEQTRALSGTSHVPVVAIGASAGGIYALQIFFEALPPHTGAAFVVILHLAPEHRSDLSSILAARTPMAVTQVHPGPERVHLISCRNVLIYFDRDLQRQEFGTFNYALVSGGYLFLGQSETADVAGDAFPVVDKDAHIYKSVGRLPEAALPPAAIIHNGAARRAARSPRLSPRRKRQ